MHTKGIIGALELRFAQMFAGQIVETVRVEHIVHTNVLHLTVAKVKGHSQDNVCVCTDNVLKREYTRKRKIRTDFLFVFTCMCMSFGLVASEKFHKIVKNFTTARQMIFIK
jgi:hypothetical protein